MVIFSKPNWNWFGKRIVKILIFFQTKLELVWKTSRQNFEFFSKPNWNWFGNGHRIKCSCTTMPMKRTSPSWTSFLENQLCLVKKHNSIPIKNCFPEFERSPKMTWLDFISGFGGICGLCLGISFVSVVEILYWFSIRLCKKFWSINNVKVSVFAMYFSVQ